MHATNSLQCQNQAYTSSFPSKNNPTQSENANHTRLTEKESPPNNTEISKKNLGIIQKIPCCKSSISKVNLRDKRTIVEIKHLFSIGKTAEAIQLAIRQTKRIRERILSRKKYQGKRIDVNLTRLKDNTKVTEIIQNIPRCKSRVPKINLRDEKTMKKIEHLFLIGKTAEAKKLAIRQRNLILGRIYGAKKYHTKRKKITDLTTKISKLKSDKRSLNNLLKAQRKKFNRKVKEIRDLKSINFELQTEMRFLKPGQNMSLPEQWCLNSDYILFNELQYPQSGTEGFR